MISVPAVLMLVGIWWCGWVRAFIIVFPGSLEGLRFIWVIQKYEVYSQCVKGMRLPRGCAGGRGSCSI